VSFLERFEAVEDLEKKPPVFLAGFFSVWVVVGLLGAVTFSWRFGCFSGRFGCFSDGGGVFVIVVFAFNAIKGFFGTSIGVC
jgi:hypothetical protein